MIARHGLIELVLLLQDDPQVVVGIGIVGLEAEGLLKTCRRLVEPALLRQHDSQVVLGLGVVGFEAEGLLIAGHGLVEPALPRQGNAQVVVGLGRVGLEAEGLLIVRDGLVEPALLPEGITQIELDVGEVRFESQRLLEARHRLDQVPLPRQCDPQVFVPLGLVRPEPEGLLKVRCRLTELAQHQAGRTEARRAHRHCQDRREELDGRPAALMRVTGLMIPPADRQRFSKLRHGPPSYHRILSYNKLIFPNLTRTVVCRLSIFVPPQPALGGPCLGDSRRAPRIADFIQDD